MNNRKIGILISIELNTICQLYKLQIINTLLILYSFSIKPIFLNPTAQTTQIIAKTAQSQR